MALYDNVLLLSDSKQQLEQILAMVAPAVTRPRISDFVEDYFIYELQLEDPLPPLDEVVQTMRTNSPRSYVRRNPPVRPRSRRRSQCAYELHAFGFGSN